MFFRTKKSGTVPTSRSPREPLGTGDDHGNGLSLHLGRPRPTLAEWPTRCPAGPRALILPVRPPLRHMPRDNSPPSPPARIEDRASCFERLWRETGCQRVIEQLLDGRRFESDVERAVFFTVLHRLFNPGSDRAADKWRTDYQIDGCDSLQLHHLYRAMAWLGEELPQDQQKDKTPFAPRCIKDRIEEGVFNHRRDLFSGLQLVFFDTTSIYFEGEGGQDIGQRGFSKDHRPDLYQMVVGAVLDGQGRPICCELWPGNTTDVKTLIPLVNRLRSRFGIGRVCIVADRGMISQETLAALEQPERGWQYILGARMRSQNEVKDEVLSRAGRYRVVHPPRVDSDDPSPLKVKEVWVDKRRYIVCLNDDEARKDAADREAIVAALREHLRNGDKSLVGNKGYRRYLRARRTNNFDQAMRRRGFSRVVPFTVEFCSRDSEVFEFIVAGL